MTNPPPIAEDLWATVPPAAQAALAAAFAALQHRAEQLEQRLVALETRLNQNSTNSSRPPSTDPPGFKRQPPPPRGQRRRGGQSGHARAIRPLVPADQVTHTVVCTPQRCRRCGTALDGVDATPQVHQVAEIPPLRPTVTAYHLHRLSCTRCHTVTTAAVPPGVPRGHFGPRVQAVLSMLAGGYRLSKRQVQRLANDLLGLRISTGMICKLERHAAATLADVVADLASHVRQAPAVNIDETGWRQARRRGWLWLTRTPQVSVFAVTASRSAAVAAERLGPPQGRVITSDRFSAYAWLKPANRQVCWAHLRRDFQAMIDRGGGAASLGQQLLAASNRLFAAWHRVRDGTAGWGTLTRVATAVRGEVRRLLEAGWRLSCGRTAAVCWEILKVERGLWSFVRTPGVEPTNNAAERTLRHAVIWRRLSGGTDSVGGSRFVERLLSVVATCQQQGRDVLDYLSGCFQAQLSGHRVASLLPH